MLLAVVLPSCGDESLETTPVPPPPDDGCAPGERPLDDGACQPAGVVACAAGFEADGTGGCRAILPAEPCPKGSMAVPGETSCREVSPCGRGKWGERPPPTGALYVDAAYLGGDGDGSEAKPYTTIEDAVLSAPRGATVVVAEGSYAEHVDLNAPITLRGRCP